MTTLTKLALILGIAWLLFLHPASRRAIYFILPLGRGWDDVVFWVLLVAFGLVAFVKGWISLPKIKTFISRIEREENE